jgi:hypothetical protein
MSQISTLPQLPGVYFTPPPRQRPAFPRLDVAAFVGYAERGPTNLPVAVEDISQYEEVFGGDLPLARDERGDVVYANLPTAVRSFFANGGRRCHVVRVAGRAASAARFSLPGLVTLDGGTPHLTTIAASGVGRWANRLQIGTRLRSRPFPAGAFEIVADGLRWTAGSDRDAIQPGDILRLTAAEGARWLVAVDGVRPAPGFPEGIALDATDAWRVGLGRTSPPEAIVRVDRVASIGSEPLGASGHAWGDRSATELTVEGPVEPRPRRGDLLVVELTSGTWLMSALDVRDEGEGRAPGTRRRIVTGGPAIALEAASLEPVSPPETFASVERLRFDVLVRSADRVSASVTDLSFGPGASRWWEDLLLPESGTAHSAAPAKAHVGQADDRGRRTPASISAAFRDHRRGRRPRDDRGPVLDRTVLAGVLAPEAPEAGVLPPSAPRFLPVGLSGAQTADDFVPPLAPGDDDLSSHSAEPFVDDALASVPAGRLMTEAFDLAVIRERRLDGIHAVLLVDEVAMLAVPDAAHRPWMSLPQEPPEPAPPEIPIIAPDPCVQGGDRFETCDRPPTIISVTPSSGVRPVGTPVVIEGSGYIPGPVEVLFGTLPARDVVILGDRVLTCRTPADTSPPSDERGSVDVAVRTPDGEAMLATGFVYVAPDHPLLPEQLGTALLIPNDFAPLRTIHAAAARACHGRGDMVALLDLPAHFRAREAIEWQEQLRLALGLSSQGGPGDIDQAVDLSFTAVFHPWLIVEPHGGSLPLRAIPPDGAMAGVVAARELARAAWIAPANEPLRDALGLVPDLTRAEWASMFAEQLNVIRPEASDFRPMSAHTLSDVAGLLQVSTRRLLILLRKAVLDRGMDYVFESNHERFRDGVAAALRDLLRTMDEAGAFAGTTPDESYRIDTGDGPNPPDEVERGRFVALIGIAPAQPAEFISVALTRTDQGALTFAGA